MSYFKFLSLILKFLQKTTFSSSENDNLLLRESVLCATESTTNGCSVINGLKRQRWAHVDLVEVMMSVCAGGGWRGEGPLSSTLLGWFLTSSLSQDSLNWDIDMARWSSVGKIPIKSVANFPRAYEPTCHVEKQHLRYQIEIHRRQYYSNVSTVYW